MKPAEAKAARLLQIEALLLEHPEGLSQADIASRLGVHRSTVLRNLADLQTPVFEEDRKIFIDRRAYLVNVRLNMHEALSIHLAARLLALNMDRQNPHAAAALRKLSIALERLAPKVSQHLARSADKIDEDVQWQDPIYLGALETLTQAWAEGRKTTLWYRKDNNEPVYQFTFCPYTIEPSQVGRSTYVIGWREPPGQLRTLKVERIQRIELSRETYAIPDDFNPTELFNDAWGIWYTDSEPVEVKIKFGARVAGRIGETRWHRSEQVRVQADGSLLWRAWIAEPQEMLPWVRGWGADAEVLEPAWLREALVEEVKRMANLYGLNGSED